MLTASQVAPRSILAGALELDHTPKLEIGKVDGTAVRETPWAARLEAAGFTSAYKGMLYRT